jgi:hypothetical protein
MTAIDLGRGTVDLLKVGEGFAEGGWGIPQDLLRIVGIAAPLAKGVGALRTGLLPWLRGITSINELPGLHLGRAAVLEEITNPQATKLGVDELWDVVKAGGGKANDASYSLANIERYPGPIYSHLDQVFFNTGPGRYAGALSRAEVRLLLERPDLLERTTFALKGVAMPKWVAQLLSAFGPTP